MNTITKNVPKLRFPEFDKKWKEKKLGDLCSYKNGGAFEQYLVADGRYYLITLNSIDIEGNLKSKHKTVSTADWYLEENDLIEIKTQVDNGNFVVGFGMLPLTIDEIKKVADEGLTMPPKSTYIEPKLRSGLTVYEF